MRTGRYACPILKFCNFVTMALECIILAGGLGTRLRRAVPDLPKCLAPVAGRPFISYLVENLEEAGFSRIILSLGYMHEKVEEWAATHRGSSQIVVSVEEKPLGTGGGIKLALSKALSDNVFVINGDTWFDVPFASMMAAHRNSGAEATIALKRMLDFDRYGEVTVCSRGGASFVSRFEEKRQCSCGLINGGVYIIGKTALDSFPEAFSIEKELFVKCAEQGALGAFESQGFFLDIGVEEDYARAQEIFADARHKRYDTLFLDRDGVINRELTGSYVTCPEEFEFLPGVKEALRKLSSLFARIVVVTNQRGIVKGLMSDADLEKVHAYMVREIEAAGGRIDRIYCSKGMDCSDPMRKPNPGMILKAVEDRPSTDLKRSFLAGDKETDMECARRSGVRGVMISPGHGLLEFAETLMNQQLCV